jgi:hypothetical protein
MMIIVNLEFSTILPGVIMVICFVTGLEAGVTDIKCCSLVVLKTPFGWKNNN